MKEFLAKNKWMGFIVVLLYAFVVAVYTSQMAIPFIKEYTPIAAQEAEKFLPITIEDNVITEPVNTIITETYGSGMNEFSVILNTKVDEFEASDLTKSGLYISKKYVYAVTPQKTEIRSFESMKFSNMVIDSDVVKSLADYIEKNLGKYVFGAVFAFMLLFSCAAILLYTIFSHWIVAIWFKQPFSQTLFINSIAYVALGLLNMFAGFGLGVIVTFVALIAVNVGVCSSIKNNAPEEA